MSIKAIETHYKGYRFRSRLEARWAVFFDALGVVWEYEVQGFDLGEAGCYLPDFFLPEMAQYIEIKGDGMKSSDRAKVLSFSETSMIHVFTGTPCFDLRDAWKQIDSFYFRESDKNWLWFVCQDCSVALLLPISALLMPCPFCDPAFFLRNGEIRFESNRDAIMSLIVYCLIPNIAYPDERLTKMIDGKYPFHKYFTSESPILASAYEAARSARFEHGESPQFLSTKR